MTDDKHPPEPLPEEIDPDGPARPTPNPKSPIERWENEGGERDHTRDGQHPPEPVVPHPAHDPADQPLPGEGADDMTDDNLPDPRPEEIDPIGPGQPVPETLPEEREEDDEMTDHNDPLRSPRDPHDIPEVEQPVESYEEDEVPLESVRDLDELPASADIVEDEAAVDHNLPTPRGMPK